MLTVALSASAAADLPSIRAIETGVAASGLVRSPDGSLDNDRFPVAFPVHHLLARLHNPGNTLSVEITALGRRGGRLDSLGVKFLFGLRPQESDLDADVAGAVALLRAIGLSASSRAAVSDLIAVSVEYRPPRTSRI